MLKNIFLIFSILMLTSGLPAQNVSTRDTIANKNVNLSKDTTIILKPVVPQPKETPAKKKVRKDTRLISDRINFDLNTGFWINPGRVFGEASLLISYRFPRILSIGAGPVCFFNYQRGPKQNLNGWGGKVSGSSPCYSPAIYRLGFSF